MTRCSAKAPPRLPAERWSAARQVLVPPAPSTLRLCRYSGLNARLRLTLVSSRLVTSPTLVAELVDEFDRLPPPPRGAFNCPADDGSQIVALLAYPGHREVMVSVGLTGCNAVTNGSVQRNAAGIGSPPAFGPQLVAQLERLVGGRSQAGAGSADVLAHGHWSVLARSPLGTRYEPTFVWDGRELLELGGTAGGRLGGAPRDTGAAYEPSEHRWRSVASAPAAVLPAGAASVWTGHQVFIFGGLTLPNERGADVAGLYDPAANRWTVTSRAPVGPFNQSAAVSTGSTVILAGTARGSHERLEVASYAPSSGKWTLLDPPINVHHAPLAMAMVATNDGVLLWSLWGRLQQTGPGSYHGLSGIDVFRLLPSGTWINVTGSWPQNRTVSDPLFTGTRVLLPPSAIWCGACMQPLGTNGQEYLVDPRTLRRTAIPRGPLDAAGPEETQIIWTGSAEVSLDLGVEIGGPGEYGPIVRPGDIAIWNPATRRWARGPRAPTQLLLTAPAVWGGNQVFALAQDGHLLAYGR